MPLSTIPTAPPRKRHHSFDRVLGVEEFDPKKLSATAMRLARERDLLARERDLLETVANTVREGIVVMDAAGVIEYANQAAEVILGLRENDIGKVKIWDNCPDLKNSLLIHFDGVGDDDVGGEIYPVVTRDIEINYPQQRHVRLNFSRLQDAAPAQEPRFAVILLDITSETRSTEALVERERADSISPLAAALAHELGNPLNSINIHLQLIRRRLEKLEDRDAAAKLGDSVRVCSEEIRRLDGLVRNFLDAMRPVPPELRDTLVLDVLTQVLDLLKIQCEDLGIRVSLNIRQDLPLILADANQLKQVFFNLLKNAMEAMDKGGSVTITADADDEFVCVRVSDTGAGIERDDASRLFDPFFTTKKGGHGLGMLVVTRILRAHGAGIGVESIPGHGTSVTVRFPRKHRRVRLLAEKKS
jgi:PAS domain S-box-containing protein